jgi:hypothetical protein
MGQNVIIMPKHFKRSIGLEYPLYNLRLQARTGS